jgi:drug/metabolite transporter (DMT)-like permease
MAAPHRAIPGWSGLPAHTRGIVWMCGAAVCYASLYVTLRQVTAHYSPLELIFLRSVFCTLFMLPWLARSGLAVLRTPRFTLHATRMTATYVAGVLWVYGVAHLPMADVNALNFTSPLFVVLIAMLVLGDKASLHRWIVLGIGFVGTLVILRPGADVISTAALVTVASSCLFATSHSITKYMASTEDPNLNVFYLYALQSLLALIPAALVWTTPDLRDLAWIVAVSLGTLGAQQCIVRSLTAAPASLVMPFNFLQLPIVAFAGLAIYDEVTSLWTWIGAAVICATNYDLARRERRR